MLIDAHALNHWIDGFYGYGSWHSRIWFIAHEESGGNLPEEVADKLNFFLNQHSPESDAQAQLCDIREMYKHVGLTVDGPKAELFSTQYDYRFGLNAIQNNIWKNLIAFEHGYRNAELPDLLEYQKLSFATTSEALIPLYPLPAPHTHSWYYSWLDLPQHGFLKSRALYEEHVYEQRIDRILSNLSHHKPEVVMMYAMNNIVTLKRSVLERFPKAKFKMVNAVKLQIPQHHIADLNGTQLLITTQIPALRHNRIDSGFDWQLLGRQVSTRT